VLPVSEKYSDFAKKVCRLMNNSDIRSSVDDRNETLGKRIREISLLRVPVLAIVGEKEVAEGTVSVRKEGADAGTMKVEDFIAWFKAEVARELA
jgi:threonyl-tRNA synthetase